MTDRGHPADREAGRVTRLLRCGPAQLADAERAADEVEVDAVRAAGHDQQRLAVGHEHEAGRDRTDGQPSAAAASRAVWVDSSNSRISADRPAAASASATRWVLGRTGWDGRSRPRQPRRRRGQELVGHRLRRAPRAGCRRPGRPAWPRGRAPVAGEGGLHGELLGGDDAAQVLGRRPGRGGVAGADAVARRRRPCTRRPRRSGRSVTWPVLGRLTGRGRGVPVTMASISGATSSPDDQRGTSPPASSSAAETSSSALSWLWPAMP